MSGSLERCVRTPDASLYVLGEMPGRQQDSFARHLRRCGECAEEVDLLQQAAEAVPLLSSPQAPSADEGPRVGQPPTLAVAASRSRAAAAAARPSASGRPALRPIEGGAGSAPARSRGRRRLLKNPVPKPAMVGLLALAVLATVTVELSSQGASVRYYRIQAGWSGGGAAVQLLGDRLRLLVEGMPRPAAGRGYQVWVVDRANRRLTPTSAWLHLNGLGQAGVTVPGSYHDWLAVAVYPEPLTGPDTTASGAAVVGDLRRLS